MAQQTYPFNLMLSLYMTKILTEKNKTEVEKRFVSNFQLFWIFKVLINDVTWLKNSVGEQESVYFLAMSQKHLSRN